MRGFRCWSETKCGFGLALVMTSLISRGAGAGPRLQFQLKSQGTWAQLPSWTCSKRTKPPAYSPVRGFAATKGGFQTRLGLSFSSISPHVCGACTRRPHVSPTPLPRAARHALWRAAAASCTSPSPPGSSSMRPAPRDDATSRRAPHPRPLARPQRVRSASATSPSFDSTPCSRLSSSSLNSSSVCVNSLKSTVPAQEQACHIRTSGWVSSFNHCE
jgi:hypothetical protein